MNLGNWDQIEKQQIASGLIRQVFSGENCTLCLNTMTKEMPNYKQHTHPHEQILIIMSGTARITFGDEETVMQKGDMLLVPPNVPHSLTVISDEPVVNLDVFAPQRTEYL